MHGDKSSMAINECITRLGKVYDQLGESWFIVLICISLGMDSWLSLSVLATSPPLRRECSDIQKNVTDCLSIAWVKVLSQRRSARITTELNDVKS